MAQKRQRALPADLPLHEELEALVRWYHHLQNEHQSASTGSGVRRRLEDAVLDTRERIDRLLEEWVPEDDVRQAWLEHVDNHGPAPDRPGTIRPLLFRGVNEAASVAEVRRGKDGLDVEVDGTLVERVEAEADLSREQPPVHLRVDGYVFEETFEASPDALAALEDFLGEDGATPPWDHASELLADGVIDVHVDLTPRGRRALARA